MINKKDFELIRKDITEQHEDYWFKVSGDSKNFLTDEYMEQAMIEVTDVVYSLDEDAVGVKRLFLFNFDVVLSDNKELKNILRELSLEEKN